MQKQLSLFVQKLGDRPAKFGGELSLSEGIDEAAVDHFAKWNFVLEPAGLDLLLDGRHDSRIKNPPVERE
jgi:hypothetical protein